MTNMKTQSQEKIRKKQEREEILDRAAWQWLLADERGQRIVFSVLSLAGVTRCAFNPNALATAFAEGQRNVGTWVLSHIARYAPEIFPKIFTMRNDDDD